MNNEDYTKIIEQLEKTNTYLLNTNANLRKSNVFLLILTVLAVLSAFLKILGCF